MHRRKKILVTTLLSAIWIVLLGSGIAALTHYENSAGSTGPIPVRWPAEAAIPLSEDNLTLVMFAHPRCPCTEASISELARIMARGHPKLSAYVCFWKPREHGTDWDDTANIRAAGQIPGLQVKEDVDGVEAERFGAKTSGYVVLFDRTGRCLFRGGITAARGHAGDNAGESAIVSLLNNRAAGQNATPVFGCSLGNSRIHPVVPHR